MLRDDGCGDQYFEGMAGDDLAIPFQLLDASGDPVNLGSASNIVAEFLNGSGNGVDLSLEEEQIVVVDGGNGRGMINVPAETSATLKTDKVRRQTFTVYTIVSGKQQTWSFVQGLLLKPRPVPPPVS
jgi:hypothetical protein